MSDQQPEYATRRIEVRGETTESGKRLMIDLVVCTRCGSYVWDLQAHETWHQPAPCCAGGPQWGHSYDCPKLPG